MRNILLTSTLLLALLLASCNPEEIDNGRDIPIITEADTHVSTRIAIALSDNETLTVNTIRVIIFTAGGDYITHRLYRVSNGDRIFTRDANGIIIDGTALGGDNHRFSIPTISGNSNVYVILNEESGELTGALDDIKTTPSPMAALRGLLLQPIAYTELIEANGEEPAFVMYIRGSFIVPERYEFNAPYVLDFSALAPELNNGSTAVQLIRSMSRVTITGITSELMDKQANDRCPKIMAEISRIFILEMGLRNVPEQFWLASNTTTVPTWREFSFNGAGVFHQDDPDHNIHYFPRNWDGEMSITILPTGVVRQVSRLRDGIIWHTGLNSNPEYTLHPCVLDNNFNSNNITGGTARWVTYSEWVSNQNRGLLPIPNSGNFRIFYAIQYQNTFNAAGNGTNFLTPEFEFRNITQDNFHFNIDGCDWSLVVEDMSFYIPENRHNDRPTSLYIRAVKASAPTTIKGFDIAIDDNDIVWGNWNFSTTPGGGNIPAANVDNPMINNSRRVLIDFRRDWVQRPFTSLSEEEVERYMTTFPPHESYLLGQWGLPANQGIVWIVPDEHQNTPWIVHGRAENGLPDGTVWVGTVTPIVQRIVRHYWDLGILRWRDGVVPAGREVTFTTKNDPEIDLAITLDDKASAAYFEIPIADDGITLRNHEYRFSVHATHPWWNESEFLQGNVTTPAGSGVLRSSANGISPFVLQRVE